MSVILRDDTDYFCFSQAGIPLLFSRNILIKSHFERKIIPELFEVHIPTLHSNSFEYIY